MNDNHIVSVVVTCYNQGRFLPKAIDSVLNQTHSEVDLIVVDDGSTDDTASVAKRYTRSRYVYQPNQGVSIARNTGIRESRGAFLTFLDADDCLLPGALAAGLECFRRYPASAFVVGRYRKIAADGTPASPPNRPCGARDFYLAMLQGNVIGMHAAVLYRRRVFDKVGGFERRCKCCEDYDMYLRIAREFAVAEHSDVIAEYRSHDRNVSSNYRFMLHQVLDVLHRQWPHARGTPEHKRAFRAGVANWRRLYGMRMLSDLRRDLKSHGVNLRSLERTWCLVACYPQVIGSLAAEALRVVRISTHK